MQPPCLAIVVYLAQSMVKSTATTYSLQRCGRSYVGAARSASNTLLCSCVQQCREQRSVHTKEEQQNNCCCILHTYTRILYTWL